MKKILITFLLINSHLAFACLNGESRELADGTFLYHDFEGNVIPRGHDFYLNTFESALQRLDSLWSTTKEVQYYSDYGLLLILLKRYPEAEEIFLEIEKQFPNRYSTASNLGTLYELMGRNQEALTWISKAVEIDPLSHKGSEWLHVNILKAKLDGEDAMTQEFLLGTSFGNSIIPSTELSEAELLKLRDALYFQLNERISFIKPPDKIVGVLLAALGDVCWLTGIQVAAMKNYLLATEYMPDNELLDAKLRRSQEKQVVIPVGKVNDSRDYSALYLVITLSVVAMAIQTISALKE